MLRKIRSRLGSVQQLRDLVRTSMDHGFYISTYPELAALDAYEAVDHFLDQGWKEGKQPCSWFDTAHYLTSYPEVAESGQNPFLHYLIYGRAEGRRPFPVSGSANVVEPVEAKDLFLDSALRSAEPSPDPTSTPDLVAGSPEFKTWGDVDRHDGPEQLGERHRFGFQRTPETVDVPLVIHASEADERGVVTEALQAALRITNDDVLLLGPEHLRPIADFDQRLSFVRRSLHVNLLCDLRQLQVLVGETKPVVVLDASIDASVNSVPVMLGTLEDQRSGIVTAPIYSRSQLSSLGPGAPTSPEQRRLRRVAHADDRFFCISPEALACGAGAVDFEGACSDVLRSGLDVLVQGTVFALSDRPSVTPTVSQHEAPNHVLILDADWPTPDRDAGSLYTFNIVRLLLDEGNLVSFAVDSPTGDLSATSHLQALGVRCLYAAAGESLTHQLETLSAPNVVFAFRHAVAREHHHEMRLRWPEAKFVFHSLDLHGLRLLRKAEELESQTEKNRARRVAADELLLFEEFDVGTVVSTYEVDFVRDRIRSGEVRLLPIPIDISDTRARFSGRLNFCFIGSFLHPPNVDAVHFLVEDVLPLVRAERPDAVLHIVGQSLPGSVDIDQGGVEYHGFVPDLDGFMASMDVSVAPLRFGAGIKGKVLSSLAVGLPIVGTSIAFEGMSIDDEVHAVVGESARDIADALIEVSANGDLWERLSINGLALIGEVFSMEAVRAQLIECVKVAGVDLGRGAA